MSESSGKEMTFFEHIEELRWHLIRSMAAIGVFFVLAFISKRFIFEDVIFAPTEPSFATYKGICWLSSKLPFIDLCIREIPFTIVNLEMTGQFLVHIKVSFIAGIVVAFPYILWEVWKFVSPALYDEEKQTSRLMVFSGSMLFYTGVVFGYFLLTPFSVNFFSSYSVSEEMVNNTFSLTSYISFVGMFVMASGILFELPLVVYFLSKMGLVTPEGMKDYRKHAYVIILILAAFITPADIGTMFLVAVPVSVLYELSIGISRRVVKQRLLREQLESTS